MKTKKIIITKDVLSQLVREALDGEKSEGAVNVNSNVDPSASVTDPINPNFTPQNRAELGIKLKDMIKAVPNDKVPTLYKNLKAVVDDVPEIADEEEKAMKKQNDKTIQATEKGATAEALIRKMVRKAISEAEWKDPADAQADEEEASSSPVTRKAYKDTAIGGMHDVGGASFEQIAKELGFSVAGAKQAVDKALLKARTLVSMDEDELEIFTLQAMKDYIDVLNKTGELTPADVKLMHDHPDVVRQLDGFREFLDKQFRRARRKGELPGAEGGQDQED